MTRKNRLLSRKEGVLMSKLISYYEDFDRPVPPAAGGPLRRETYDVAVVGAGAAGLAAAVRAAELGKKVVLLEKTDTLGGNSRLAGGLLCTNSKVLAADGIPDTTAEHISLYERTHLYQLDKAIYGRFIANTGEFYDWMVKNGLDSGNRRMLFGNVVMVAERIAESPLNNPAYGPGLMGSKVTDHLIERLKALGANVLTVTRATSLKTENGAVVGLTAVGGGHEWDITAENVILATGGFGSNNELLKRFFPKYFSSNSYFTKYSLECSTGDGLLMAEEIGAEIGKNMSFGLDSIQHMPGTYTLQRVSLQPEGVLVGSTGMRFIPEDDMPNCEFALDRQPDGIGWYLFPQSKLEKLYQLSLENSRFGDWMPEVDVLYTELEQELKKGHTVMGETIEDLAAAIGAPAEVLRNTLEEYERFCQNGRDEEFLKDPKFLLPLGLEGPWYAVKMFRKFDVTMGGVSVNARLQALRPDQSVIPGLYVTGDNASNWMGENYGPFFSSFAWACNSGYLAAGECCGIY